MKQTPGENAVIYGPILTHALRLLGLITVLLAAGGCGESGTGSGPASSGPVGINSASLSWERPTTNEDGSAITDLAGYQIYYGEASPITTDNGQAVAVLDPNQTSYVVANLAPGTYHFAVTAVNLQGAESAMSEEAVKTIF